MSFTEEIKIELCRSPMTKSCCLSAEVLGLLLFCNRFGPDRIRLISSVSDVRRRVQSLFTALFGFAPEERENDNALVLEDIDSIRTVYDWFGFQLKTGAPSLNRAFVEEECCRASFLRGCFLMGGTVIAGKKGYHLELVTPHYSIAGQMGSFLYEMQMEPRQVMRRSNYVLYYKNSESIEAFLTTIGASGGAMELMLKKVEKSLVNRVNRSVNCETANLSRAADAAAKQTNAIERIHAAGQLDQLSRDLQETARLRLEHREDSLTELAARFEPPLSKPGLSARLRKLIRIAEEIDHD